MRLQHSPHDLLLSIKSVREREELVYALLHSLPKSSLATIHRNIEPMLQLDVVGLLPDEVALHVYSYLPWQSLLTCSLVNRRWHKLTNDMTLWRALCIERGWEWRTRQKPSDTIAPAPSPDLPVDEDDEGMGDDEEEDVEFMLQEDSGFNSMVMDSSPAPSCRDLPTSPPRSPTYPTHNIKSPIAGPSTLPTISPAAVQIPKPNYTKPDYKLLYLTHIRLQNRIRSNKYRLTALNTRPNCLNPHTNTIYCLQLYTYPETGTQVLFTGSKDRSVREWDLNTGQVTRVIEGVHEGSVLTICVNNGMLVSGGSDQSVVVWDLKRDTLVRVIQDHSDSVLCVRFDEKRLVSCSKDRTLRSYSLPDFALQYVIDDHRAAVNAVAISPEYIISASGDRSMKLWKAQTGELVRTFESHHGRGIASIDFKPPHILSGSSDKHLRFLDLTTSQGWSTSPDFDLPLPLTQLQASLAIGYGYGASGNGTGGASAGGSGNGGVGAGGGGVTSDTICETCGGSVVVASGASLNGGTAGQVRVRARAHADLVRSVALSADFAVSASYDTTVKIWDRKTGALVADLSGGHVSRVFCVAIDGTKVVSCGEDQRICVWDFAHGIDTSFIKL
ncbi:WD40 repeat-like protein [Panus rudis PR-1116 ss-1]|nr:WD40 repeat-like protein [Panus rudis PR-1116 ss-1]